MSRFASSDPHLAVNTATAAATGNSVVQLPSETPKHRSEEEPLLVEPESFDEGGLDPLGNKKVRNPYRCSNDSAN